MDSEQDRGDTSDDALQLVAEGGVDQDRQLAEQRSGVVWGDGGGGDDDGDDGDGRSGVCCYA